MEDVSLASASVSLAVDVLALDVADVVLLVALVSLVLALALVSVPSAVSLASASFSSLAALSSVEAFVLPVSTFASAPFSLVVLAFSLVVPVSSASSSSTTVVWSMR